MLRINLSFHWPKGECLFPFELGLASTLFASLVLIPLVPLPIFHNSSGSL